MLSPTFLARLYREATECHLDLSGVSDRTLYLHVGIALKLLRALVTRRPWEARSH